MRVWYQPWQCKPYLNPNSGPCNLTQVTWICTRNFTWEKYPLTPCCLPDNIYLVLDTAQATQLCLFQCKFQLGCPSLVYTYMGTLNWFTGAYMEIWNDSCAHILNLHILHVWKCRLCNNAVCRAGRFTLVSFSSFTVYLL